MDAHRVSSLRAQLLPPRREAREREREREVQPTRLLAGHLLSTPEQDHNKVHIPTLFVQFRTAEHGINALRSARAHWFVVLSGQVVLYLLQVVVYRSIDGVIHKVDPILKVLSGCYLSYISRTELQFHFHGHILLIAPEVAPPAKCHGSAAAATARIIGDATKPWMCLASAGRSAGGEKVGHTNNM